MLRSIFGNDINLVNIPLRANGHSKGGGLSSQTVYEINQLADGLLIGPGNLFENGALQVDLRALSALSVPTAIFSASVGRIFDRTGQLVSRTDSMAADTISALCRIAEPILVRDRATMEHLQELGCHAKVIGCPTLFLEDAQIALAPPDPDLADSVLISIRNPALMSVPYSFERRVFQDVRRMIDAFRELKMDVRLFCHDYQDLRFAQVFPDTPVLYTEDPRQFISWLRGCKLSIGFRLHAFVCCVGLGIPSIPFTYDERGMSLIEAIGLSEWAVPYLHTDDVLSQVYDRYESLSRLSELMEAARGSWKCLRRSAQDGLQSFGERILTQAGKRAF